MRYDSAGKHRSGQITSDRVAKRLFSVLKGTKFGDLEVSSHFDLIEISTLALADEIVFTNQKQLDVVLSAYPNELGNLIRHKSVVEGQPVLPDYYYGISNIAYCAPENKVNIAYFGNFYKNRGIGGVIRALSDLEATQKDRVRLHIFCSAPQELKKRIQNHGLENVVIVNNYVDYLDFLCLSKKFDVLVVEDVDTKQSGFIVNPYLPSKYLDYYGSNSRIWGIVEEGSVLSSRDLAFRSTVGNDVSIRNTLNLIIQTIGH